MRWAQSPTGLSSSSCAARGKIAISPRRPSSDLFLELTGQLHGLSATDAAFASSEIAAGGAADLLLHAADLSGPIASTYQFQHLAGANVVVIAPSAAAADAKTNLIANTDLLGLGQVDVLTNGD